MPTHRTVQMHSRYAQGLGGAGATHPDQKGQVFPHLEVRDRIGARLALEASDPAMVSAATTSVALVSPTNATPRRRMLVSSVLGVEAE